MNNQEHSCGSLPDVQCCDAERVTETGKVSIPSRIDGIGLDDELLIIRKNGNDTRIYQGRFGEMNADIALDLLKKAVLFMPREDPADGRSLWLDNGLIRLASGDINQLGVISSEAMKWSLKEAFASLPTFDPEDGTPWVKDGVLMQGTNITNEHD